MEYWQQIGLSHDINEDWVVHAEQEFRAGRRNGNPYLHNVNVGLVYKNLTDWLDIGADFKKEYEKDSAGKFRGENRPHLSLLFKGKLLDIDAGNRLRVEYRDRENKEDIFRLRNQVKLKFPVKFTKLALQPFVAEEFFVNLGDNNVSQNRLSAGFSSRPAKSVEIRVYYMWKTSKIPGGWEDTNVIGTGLVLRF
ncbi:MAG: DUF2490 domain-containing protein [Planctomycetota bacterium]